MKLDRNALVSKVRQPLPLFGGYQVVGAAEYGSKCPALSDPLVVRRADGAAVDIQEVFGQRLVVPRNGNLNLAQSLVEQVAGDFDLTKLRSRAAFTRPLTVIQQMEARAQQSYLGKIKELEDTLQQTQEKLAALQKQRGGAQSSILTPEQQTEVDNFRKKTTETKRDLKELRKNLREESEQLQFWTKLVNIATVPLLVVLALLRVPLLALGCSAASVMGCGVARVPNQACRKHNRGNIRIST